MTNENKNMKPIENNGLKEAIANLKEQGTKENEMKMFKELKDAHLLAPAVFSKEFKQDASTGRVILPKDVEIKFLLVNTSEGKSFMPAFTDMEEAKKLPVQDGQNVQFIVRTMDEYSKIFKGMKDGADGIVINPASQNIVIPSDFIKNFKKMFDVKSTSVQDVVKESLAKGVVPKGINVAFTDSRLYPTRVVNDVHEACSALPEVNRVWFKTGLVQMNTCHTFIFEADKNQKEVEQKLREAALEHAKGTPILVFPINKALREQVLKDDVPLYDREFGF